MNMAQQPGLQPFTKGDERARAAGRKSAQVRAAKRAAQQAAQAANEQELQHTITTHLNTFQREQLGPAALAAASVIIGRILRNEIEISEKSAADLIRTLTDIGRMEAGQATSLSGVVHVGKADLERLQALRESASSDPTPPVIETNADG